MYFSAYVYNRLDGIPFDYTHSIYEGMWFPDVVFLLSASPEIVFERLHKRSELTKHEKGFIGKEQMIIDECDAYRYLQNVVWKINW
jgi:thymidylate kinase